MAYLSATVVREGAEKVHVAAVADFCVPLVKDNHVYANFLHAAAANCEHRGGNNITLTFRFRIVIVLRKENWRLVLRFKEGNRHFVLRFMKRYRRKQYVSHSNRSTTIQKLFCDHPNKNSTTLSKQYGAKRLRNVHVDRFLN